MVVERGRLYRILIVEDDKKMSSVLARELRNYGYEAVQASRLDDIKSEFIEISPNLVILDINLPRMDGFYWCRQIRTLSKVPIVFVSSRTGDMDQVRAIENGGDDYITKPFSMEVVLAKIGSVLRRAYGEYSVSGSPPDIYSLCGLYLHRKRNEVEFRSQRAILSPKEFNLLDALARKPGEIVSREELLEALWDDVDFVDDNTLTVNVTRVRRRLEEVGIGDAISAVRGQGYRLAVTWKETG